MRRALIGLTLTVGAVLSMPAARADMPYGNYDLNIGDRTDFHTWIWAIRPCGNGCLTVAGLPQPVAKAFEYQGTATLTDGRYTFTTDVPDGLRCGNVYYGPALPTRDVYTWDERTLTGTLVSTFDAGCDSQSGSLVYPFELTRL